MKKLEEEIREYLKKLPVDGIPLSERKYGGDPDFPSQDKAVADEIVKKITQYTDSIFDGIKTEVTASKIISPPNDEFKKAWNEAMSKVVRILEMYKKGDGLFQQ